MKPHPAVTSNTVQFKIARTICARIAGGENLIEICKTKGYPAPYEVLHWYLYPDESIRPGFVEAFNVAQRVGWELMAHQLVEIADDDKPVYVMRTVRGKRVKVLDTEKGSRDRLKIDVRKFVLSKRIPETFGDSIKVEHSGQIDLVARLAAGRKRVEKDAADNVIEGDVEAKS